MTVHMVRLYLEPPRGNAEQAVENWVANHPEWTDDPVAHTLREVDPPDGTAYAVGSFRFTQSVPNTALLDDLEQRLANIQGGLWYRIGYHECDHDESDRADCAWAADETRESGGVPLGVPSF